MTRENLAFNTKLIGTVKKYHSLLFLGLFFGKIATNTM